MGKFKYKNWVEKKNKGFEIQEELQAALAQISDNKYYKELEAHQIKNQMEFAIVFVGKEVFLQAN